MRLHLAAACFSSVSHLARMTDCRGRARRSSGFSCSRSALRVAAGSSSASVSRTASPERAAQAAAGIAYSAFSPEATTTSWRACPWRPRRSGRWRRPARRGPCPRSPPSCSPRAGPARRRCGSPGRPWRGRSPGLEPLERVLGDRGQLVAVGDQERRADRAGRRARTAVTPACQSSLSTSTTAVGRWRRSWPGNTALATPGGVGGRVAAAHADRVLGGGGGEAELLRGLLVVGLSRRAAAGGGRRRRALQPPRRRAGQQGERGSEPRTRAHDSHGRGARADL